MANIPKPNPQESLKYFQQKLNCTTGPIELNHWIEEKAPVHIIDVRRPEDYAKGHIPGAVNIPKEEWQNPKGLSRDRTNIVYCYSQTCHLAASAAVEFAQSGFPVIELEGGFNTWQKARLEVAVGV